MSQENKNIIEEEQAGAESELSSDGELQEEATASEGETAQSTESETCAEEEQNEPVQDETTKKKRKDKKAIKLSLKTFAFVAVALILAAVMLTYSICSDILKAKYADGLIKGDQQTEQSGTPGQSGTNGTPLDDLFGLLQTYIDNNFYGETDPDELIENALKAYVLATGDPYSAYYTLEELLANTQETSGKMVGVGINIINTTCSYYGETIKALRVINVMDNSPALAAGIKIDDYIAFVGNMENSQSVELLGYDGALDLLLGEEGTVAEFVVLREVDGELTPIEFAIERAKVETMSVVAKVYEADKSVGIINIREFDYTTPKQFYTKVEELRAGGCDKFVIDLRYNPGGSLISVQGVLSYFLDEGDVYIQTKDNKGVVTKETIAPVTYANADMKGCDIEAEKIGIYKDLDFVVICNESTASAGELFVANVKDHGMAPVVGMNTYGKGSMQTTFPLNGGYLGAIKLTTHRYFSGGDTELVGYDGVGIKPDVEVELSEEAASYVFYVLPQDLDDQLIAAVAELGK